MKTHHYSLILILIALLAIGGRVWAEPDPIYAQSQPLALRGVAANATVIPRYGKVELTLDLTATYVNPFDPSQIDVEADFTSPNGAHRQIPGFLYQDFNRSLNETGAEALSPASTPVWMVRFAPDRVGTWQYTVTVRDPSGIVRAKPATLTVTDSSNPGFVMVSHRNPSAFAFDGEKPYFPVGEDMCWGGKAQTFSYEKWLPKLHAAGGNWIRIWMSSWNNAIEWSGVKPSTASGFHGLGVYNLATAWRLDKTLDMAADNGIYCMVCLGTFGDLSTGGYFHEGQWDNNPYNAKNGGPCQTPDDFWTNTTARALYKQRLRYIMARYGYRTNIQSWEMWNETWAPTPWLREMAQYVKGTDAGGAPAADPYHHLLSTTYAKDDGWKIPEVDWTQSHFYGVGNIADLATPIAADAAKYAPIQKPHLMAEFGIDYRKSDVTYDPDGSGVDLHNGIWASAASGNAGGAMIWWWDNYVDPENLYSQFTPLVKITSTIPWTSGLWRQVTVDPVMAPVQTETFGDLTLSAGTGWGKAAQGDFRIDPAATDPTASYPTYIYGSDKADMQTPLVFHVTYPKPGAFTVHINTVSDRSSLDIVIDGAVAREIKLDANPPGDPSVKPDYDSTKINTPYKGYIAIYDKDYSVDVPAGAHSIELKNIAGDWLSVDSYKFIGVRSNRYAHLNVEGVTDGSDALIWVQNSDHNWQTVHDKKPVPAVVGARTMVHGLNPGKYSIEWLDTYSGASIRRDTASATLLAGLPLSPPDVATDIAARIYRQ